MTAMIETLVIPTIIITIAAIMIAHHTEERLSKRDVVDGNKYHRLIQKSHRLQARLVRREMPSRHFCKDGHPLD